MKFPQATALTALFVLSACSPKPAADLPAGENLAVNAPSANATNSAAAQSTIKPASDTNLTARGKVLFTRCRACHTLKQDGRHRVGPNLWNVFGSVAGTKPQFAYSKAMAGSGVVWTPQTLAAYLENPRDFMPENRMSFAGLRKAEDQDAILSYLARETTPRQSE